MALLDELYRSERRPGCRPKRRPELQRRQASLAGKLDMTRIGLMGHSRGGDAVSSFVDYNRMRPIGRALPAARGDLAGAGRLRTARAPTAFPSWPIRPCCDGDVSNLQGARLYERSQYVNGDTPTRRIQSCSSAATTTGTTPSGRPTATTPRGRRRRLRADVKPGVAEPANAEQHPPQRRSRAALRSDHGANRTYVIDNTRTSSTRPSTPGSPATRPGWATRRRSAWRRWPPSSAATSAARARSNRI